MHYTKFFIPTLREAPGDAIAKSHILMLRAGLIRKLSNGLFAYLPLGMRVLHKLEAIIREEMQNAGSLEVRSTVVVPGELWKESGRWDAMGESLLRVKNRTGQDFVVSPTAEEAAAAIVRGELSSYKQLPINIYQINTKYRDEIRPRYGVMRAREFIMKDAYSFHSSDESLDEAYNSMRIAYKNIFERCALNVISVRADSGAMGGTGSEEFMVESEIGDNTLIICPGCGDAANVEKAVCATDDAEQAADGGQPLELIDTPNVKSIADLEKFFNLGGGKSPPPLQPACGGLPLPPSAGGVPPATPPRFPFIKTLIYKIPTPNPEPQTPPPPTPYYAVTIRGDLDVNEAKLAALLKTGEVELADSAEVERITGAPVGFAGPVGLKNIKIIADESVTKLFGAVAGANQKDKHYKNVCYGRDFNADIAADLRVVKAGDKCVHCGAALIEKKGNELGHIFKLGKKYTTSMNVRYLDEAGVEKTPTMGCYGIGLDRTIAAVIEEHCDEAGIIWPFSLAPFGVVIVPIQYKGEVKEAADKLAGELEKQKIDVLLDDRAERPGVRFNDADLTGIPIRIVIGDKNLSAGKIEVKRRSEKEASLIDIKTVVDYVRNIYFS